MRGIDVSENNGWVDWDAVKNAGVEFAIVRSSYGRNSADEMFTHNVNEASARGIKCGAYHYGYGLTPAQAKQEADNCRNVIADAGVLLELPVFYDFEDADNYKVNHGFNFSRSNCTAVCKAFLDNIQLNNGVYSSESWFDSYVDWKALGCPVWNAIWLNGEFYDFDSALAKSRKDGIKAYLWQFTDKFVINGKIFDGNIMYDSRDKAVY